MNKLLKFVSVLLFALGFGTVLVPALASASGISVWWPTNGSTLAATQPFKALVDGMPLSNYAMYWQVDSGQLNAMSDNLTDYPHKEATVDLSSWHWSSNGSYLVTFVAKDLSGNVIGTQSETIHVNVPSAAAPVPVATIMPVPSATPVPVPVISTAVSSPTPAPSPTLSGTGPAAATVQPAPAPQTATVVLSAPVLTATQSVTENIWWPSSGSIIQGTQPFKALVQNMALSSYSMYWQVDGGQLNLMADNYTDAPHKEASVNVSGWSWHGTGPYAINFVAKDQSGNIIAQKNVAIYTGTPAPTPTPSPTPISSPAPTAGTTSTAPVTGPIVFNNPLSGMNFYVDPNNEAALQAQTWSASQPAHAALMEKIAVEPVAKWLGDWNANVYSDAKSYVDNASAKGQVPILITYNIPNRDCGGYSSGGATSAGAYQSWIQGVADGIGSRRAVVVLEPDALAMIDCLSSTDAALRYSLLNQAIGTLKANPATTVYVDAGNSNWINATTMAGRLTAAGIAKADGFSLNVSNFYWTNDLITFGKSVSSQTSNKHFVIDTSRNGLGPNGSEWCNPPGRALGAKPTILTGNSLVDAFLWLKQPGESDGTCNGGPSAGIWWPDYALGLASRAAY